MAVSTAGSSWHESNRGVSKFITIYLSLFLVILVLSKFLHDYPRIGSIIPEAAMIILVGMVAGLFVFLFFEDPHAEEAAYGYDDYGQQQQYAQGQEEQVQQQTDSLADSILSFSPTVFFVVLLPPIIFNSGYHVQKELFFRHLTPIAMYAFIGTAICTAVVAALLYSFQWLYGMESSFLELLTFGALISATDPVSTLAVFSSKHVDPQLFYLVFGESMLNDAVGLVLFNALAHLLENHLGQDIQVGDEVKQFLFDFVVAFLGSLVLGIVFALAMAMLLKYLDFRSTPILELCLAFTFMYLPFVVAELFHLSGIVTVLFAGIACRRYVEPNLSSITAVNADWIYRLTAHVTETLIFLELGLSVWSLIGHGAFSFGFLLTSLLACLIGRAVNIYPLTLLYNLTRGRKAGNEQKQNAVNEAEETDYVAATDDNIDKKQQSNGTTDDIATAVQPSPSFEDDSRVPWRTAHMMWFSGLRGAVSYGLARTFPDTNDKNTIVVTTMLLVLLTTFFLGGTTEIMMNILHVPTGIDEDKYLESIEKRKLLPGFLLRFESSKLFPWVVRDAHVLKNKKVDKNQADDEDDPEISRYENIEVVSEGLHRISIVQTNRNRKIFDYGA